MSAIWSCDDWDLMKVSANLSPSTNDYCYICEVQRKPTSDHTELTYAWITPEDHSIPVDTADDQLVNLLIPCGNTFISGLSASFNGTTYSAPNYNAPVKYSEKTGL